MFLLGMLSGIALVFLLALTSASSLTRDQVNDIRRIMLQGPKPPWKVQYPDEEKAATKEEK